MDSENLKEGMSLTCAMSNHRGAFTIGEHYTVVKHRDRLVIIDDELKARVISQEVFIKAFEETITEPKEIAKRMLANGWKLIVCGTYGNGKVVIEKYNEAIGRFVDANGLRYSEVKPLDAETGDPYTDSILYRDPIDYI